MKKILVLLVVTGLIAGIGVTYTIKSLNQNPKQEQVNVSNKIAEENVENDLESEVLSESISDDNQVIEKKKQGNTDVTQIKPKTNSETKKQATTKEEIPKVENKDQTNPIEEKKIEPPKQEIIEKPEIDEEYEKLKRQVQYATYEECMSAGFEIASKDTVNILGFSCPYVVYKGKILGYRLQLDYTNPMNN